MFLGIPASHRSTPGTTLGGQDVSREDPCPQIKPGALLCPFYRHGFPFYHSLALQMEGFESECSGCWREPSGLEEVLELSCLGPTLLSLYMWETGDQRASAWSQVASGKRPDLGEDPLTCVHPSWKGGLGKSHPEPGRETWAPAPSLWLPSPRRASGHPPINRSPLPAQQGRLTLVRAGN